MRARDLDALPSFALLGPGFAGETALLSPLSPCDPRDADLLFLPYEDREPQAFRAGARRPVSVEVDPPPPLAPAFDPAPFLDGVRAIRASIAAGDVYQVNLTVRAALGPVAGPDLLAATWSRGPARYAAWVRLPSGFEMISASPELFFEIEGRSIRAEPMKGTARDAADLEGSAKDRAELAMITDLLRNDLTPLCAPRTVRVACERRTIALPYAAQTVSDVVGELLPGVGPLEALAALHPGGSITGAPKSAAMEHIRRLEPPRGPYCGALGLVDGARAVVSLLIRTAWREGAGWTYGAGGGIVWGSDPERELDEVRVKLGALACAPRP